MPRVKATYLSARATDALTTDHNTATPRVTRSDKCTDRNETARPGELPVGQNGRYREPKMVIKYKDRPLFGPMSQTRTVTHFGQHCGQRTADSSLSFHPLLTSIISVVS